MHSQAFFTTLSRLSAVSGLILLLSLTSGCATRALMSSDRYEAPQPSTQKYHSSEMQNLEQAYQLALQQHDSVDH